MAEQKKQAYSNLRDAASNEMELLNIFYDLMEKNKGPLLPNPPSPECKQIMVLLDSICEQTNKHNYEKALSILRSSFIVGERYNQYKKEIEAVYFNLKKEELSLETCILAIGTAVAHDNPILCYGLFFIMDYVLNDKIDPNFKRDSKAYADFMLQNFYLKAGEIFVGYASSLLVGLFKKGNFQRKMGLMAVDENTLCEEIYVINLCLIRHFIEKSKLGNYIVHSILELIDKKLKEDRDFAYILEKYYNAYNRLSHYYQSGRNVSDFIVSYLCDTLMYNDKIDVKTLEEGTDEYFFQVSFDFHDKFRRTGLL